ncbi:MAG: S24 family peptidase [Blautia producta]|nr:S24 family peptidase [Blautia producta]
MNFPTSTELRQIAALPMFHDLMACDFTSPTQDYVERHIVLNQLMIPSPNATYFVKSSRYLMIDAGIGEGDFLGVDNSRRAEHGCIAIVAIEGELTVKHLQLYPFAIFKPENSVCKPILIGSEDSLEVFTVVTYIVKSASRACLHCAM